MEVFFYLTEFHGRGYTSIVNVKKGEEIMKKILTALFSIGLLFGLTSCGGIGTKFYTITYETEHGTAPLDRTAEDGQILDETYIFPISADGYTFKGWFDGETEVKAGEYKVTKDVTFTAKWEVAVKTYTVSFTTAIGTKPDSYTVAENTVLTAEQLPAIEDPDGNHVFKGWYDDDILAKAGEYKVTKNVIFTAEWKSILTVTYQSEFGTAPEAIKVEEGTKLTSEQLPTLSATDYTFKGWYDTNGVLVEADKYEVNSTVLLTAKWIETVYTQLAGSWKNVPNQYTLVKFDLAEDKSAKVQIYKQKKGDYKVFFYQYAGVYSVNKNQFTIEIEKYINPDGTTILISELGENSPEFMATGEFQYFVDCPLTISSDKFSINVYTMNLDFFKVTSTINEDLCLPDGQFWYVDDGQYSTEYKVQLNKDNTVTFAYKTYNQTPVFLKGTYVIYENFLHLKATEMSRDGQTWIPDTTEVIYRLTIDQSGEVIIEGNSVSLTVTAKTIGLTEWLK